jgi:hypothetical protein
MNSGELKWIYNAFQEYFELIEFLQIPTNSFQIQLSILRHDMRVVEIIWIYYIMVYALVVCSNRSFKFEEHFFQKGFKTYQKDVMSVALLN